MSKKQNHYNLSLETEDQKQKEQLKVVEQINREDRIDEVMQVAETLFKDDLDWVSLYTRIQIEHGL